MARKSTPPPLVLPSWLSFFIILAFLLCSTHSFSAILMPDFITTPITIFEFQYPYRANSTYPLKFKEQVCSQSDNQQFIVDKNRFCIWRINVCLQPIRQITRFNFNAQALTPGTLVQIFQHRVMQAHLKGFPIKPISIKLENGLSAIFEGNNKQIDFKQQFTQFLASNLPYLNARQLELNIVPPSKIEKALGALGLSTSIYQQLRIARSQINPVSATKRILLILHQNFFSATVQQPAGDAEDRLFEYFFGNNSQDLLQIKSLINDPDNPLQFISRTNYGRLLIFSLDYYSEGTIKQIDNLYNCISNGVIETICFSLVMQELQFNPTLRYYFAGVEESLPLVKPCEYCKPVVNWHRIFFPLNATSVEYLRPLIAQATSFTGQRYVQQQFRFFQVQSCRKSITIQIIRISEGTSLGVLYYNQRGQRANNMKPVKHLFNATHPGTFQIGSEVGKEVFQLKFIAKGKRISNGLKFFFLKNEPIYSIQVEFALLINGEKKIAHIIGNSRSQYQFSDVVIRIDPQTQTGNILSMESGSEETELKSSLRSGSSTCCDSTQFEV